MLTDQELCTLASQGWLVGPGENEVDFLKRVSLYPTQAASEDDGHRRSRDLFDFAPLWINVIYSNKGLSFWQGGCTYIDGVRITLQLRTSIFYSKGEILSHEYVHVARMAFHEPLFEEFFAYQTASNSFRRFWGPFFRTPRESTLFIGFMVASCLANLLFPFLTWTWMALSLLLGWGVFRLLKGHSFFKRCRNRFYALIGSQSKALKVMLCLTDQEIKDCSKRSPKEIKDYFLARKHLSLRHQQIAALIS